MAWQLFVDDGTTDRLQVVSDVSTQPMDVPLDGIQAIAIDGAVNSGYDHYFWGDDDAGGFWGFARGETPEKILERYPMVRRISRGRWTTMSRWYRVKEAALLFAGHQAEVQLPPNPVVVAGWRCWTSNDVFDSVGVAQADLLSHWASVVPADDVQVVMLYLSAGGQPEIIGRWVLSGASFYAVAPHPSGEFIFGGGEDTDIATRYPGASIKRGKFIDLNRYEAISAEAMASRSL